MLRVRGEVLRGRTGRGACAALAVPLSFACALALAGCSFLPFYEPDEPGVAAPHEPSAAASETSDAPAEQPTSPAAAVSPPAVVELVAEPAPPAGAADAGPRAPGTPLRRATRLEAIRITPSWPSTRVVLQLDGFVEPEVSLLADRRLVLDLPGTSCAGVPRTVEVEDAVLERVRTAEHGGAEAKSRVVLDLKRRTDFAVRSTADQVIVLFATAAPRTPGTELQPSQELDESERILLAAEGPGGTSPAPPPRDEPQPAALAAASAASDASGASEPASGPSEPTSPSSEPQAGSASDPAPPDASSSTIAAPHDAAAEIQPPPTFAAGAPLGDGRISVDFVETDLRTVIELVAGAGGYRVIFTPDVEGTISLTLFDRPWESVLATVLKAKGLSEVRHDDIMLVSPVARTTE